MIAPWQQRDNFSRPRHQELADGVNALAPLMGDGELDTVGTSAGRTTVDPRPLRLVPQEIPLKISATLSPAGVYRIKTGKWKKEISESAHVDLSDLFEFADNANAIGFIATEVASSGHVLTADKIVFGTLQPRNSNLGKPVFRITSSGIIDVRYNYTTDVEEVSFDGTTWIPKITYITCTTDTSKPFFNF